MKPNVLLILSDQHRFCDMGCYGNSMVQTPNLDLLAESGVLLENFYSNCPLCVPARGTLLTGNYPSRHGAVANDMPIRTDVESLADVFNEAGYETAYIGKWHLGGVPRDRAILPEERMGFQNWRGCNCNHDYFHGWYDNNENERNALSGYEPKAQTDLALDFLSKTEQKPWMLFLSYGTPHEPYEQVPEEMLGKYLENPPAFRKNVQLPAMLSKDRHVSGEQLHRWYAGYYSHISELDCQVGRLNQYLEKHNQLENTIIIYMSDHGDMLGSHGLTNKQLPYEESVHVPFILSWKGSIKSARCSGLMSIVDVAPTLLGLVGLTFSNAVDGENCQSIFLFEQMAGKEAIYLMDAIPCHQAGDRGGEEWRAVISNGWMLARTPSVAEWLLFDMKNDPFQMKNRVGDSLCQNEAKRLGLLLESMTQQYDCLLPWREYLRHYKLTDAWNTSQKYFHLPILPEGPV